MTPRWLWRARALRAVDGDTIDVELDTGFRTVRTERLRLLGLNTPETRGESREAGLVAKAFTVEWLAAAPAADWPLVVETFKADVFGRYLAVVWHADQSDGVDLGLALVGAGLAVPFRGGARDWR